jgi:hypothetical protein
MMDHEESVRAGAVEKYLLDELGDDDRARFEEHFFDCPECAEELKLTETFLAGARRVVAARAAEAPRASGWTRHFWPAPAGALAAAAVLIAVVVGHDLSARRQLAAALAPQPATWYFLAVSRGEPPVIVTSKSKRLVGMTLGEPPGPPLSSYRCEVRDAAGRVVWSFVVPAPARGREIEMMLPASELRAGSYVVALAADGGAEVARYPFTVREGED